MADVLTPEQRSHCMSRIRGKDTRPELTVRRLVHALGGRYRLNVANLPGKPDIVLPARRKIIFVHGCFWHRHSCQFGRVVPATRTEFWTRKLARNRERDRLVRKALHNEGWRVLVIWECQTRNLSDLQSRLAKFLACV